MPKGMCSFNFNDVNKAFNKFKRDVRNAVEGVGVEAVNYAVENGTYRNVSGKCRRSNHYDVKPNGSLELYNDCGYADKLESEGKDVISGAALFAEQRLKDIFG